MPSGITLAAGVLIGAPTALDAKYGPYDTAGLALADLTSGFRYQGLTVGIKSGSSVVEYWFKDGVADSNFVEKMSAAPVASVNGETGAVTLDAADVGAQSLQSVTSITVSSAQQLTAARNQRVRVNSTNTTSGAAVYLPATGNVEGDRLEVALVESAHSASLGVRTGPFDYTVSASIGLGQHRTFIYTSGAWTLGTWEAHTHPDIDPKFSSSDFRVSEVSGQFTTAKFLAFSLSGVNPGDTCTLTVPNSSGTISLVGHTHSASAISDSTAAGRALLLAANAQAQRDALDTFVSVANFAALPTTGVTVSQGGSVYVTSDNGKVYVWNGTAYTEISPNVQSNWNANSGDAQILNKPSTFPPSAHTHPYDLVVACSDEVTALTAGEKVRFLSPRFFTFTRFGASVTTAPQGASLIVDVRVNGSSVFENNSAVLIIPSGQTSFFTTVQQLGSLNVDQANQNDVISIHIIQTGAAEKGRGLKVYITGQ
jgi:hypothetical protein